MLSRVLPLWYFAVAHDHELKAFLFVCVFLRSLDTSRRFEVGQRSRGGCLSHPEDQTSFSGSMKYHPRSMCYFSLDNFSISFLSESHMRFHQIFWSGVPEGLHEESESDFSFHRVHLDFPSEPRVANEIL